MCNSLDPREQRRCRQSCTDRADSPKAIAGCFVSSLKSRGSRERGSGSDQRAAGIHNCGAARQGVREAQVGQAGTEVPALCVVRPDLSDGCVGSGTRKLTRSTNWVRVDHSCPRLVQAQTNGTRLAARVRSILEPRRFAPSETSALATLTNPLCSRACLK